MPDAHDKCPDQPETKNGYQDDDGCPDEIPAKVKKFTGVIQGINFKVSSADLLASSNATLDKAVAVLKEFPDLKLEIQGHTDDQKFIKGTNGKFDEQHGALAGARRDREGLLREEGHRREPAHREGLRRHDAVENPEGLKGAKLNAARAKNRRVEFKLVST